VAIKFYIKKGKDSLYFGHFLKVVYNRGGWFEALWIKLRKLKFFFQKSEQNRPETVQNISM